MKTHDFRPKRRDFLKKLTGTVAVAAIPAVSAEAEPKEYERVEYGGPSFSISGEFPPLTQVQLDRLADNIFNARNEMLRNLKGNVWR